MNNPTNQNKMNTIHFLRLSFPLIVAFLFISGTAFSQKKKNNSLAGHLVTSLEVKYDESQEPKPGNSFEIGVSALLTDGSTMDTRGWLKGKVKWDDFNIEVIGGTKGNGLVGESIIINSYPTKTQEHLVKIKVTCVHDPKLTATISISINYNIKCVASFNGSSGDKGSVGQKGDSGGTDGSIYSKSNGTDGKPAKDGGDGGDGRPGRNAMGVKAYVTTTKHKIGNNTLLQVVVTDANGQNIKYYVFDPTSGSLTIYANGGDGGDGGRGGDGGDGQNVEGNSDKKQTGGNGGDGGNGGNGGACGNGADGGMITIYFDPSAEVFLDKIFTSNNGGRAGSSGSSGFHGGAGRGGNGYNSGKHGTQGKSGKGNPQKGNSGNDGPPVSKIKQAIDLKQFGF